ncbi:MAG: hypothetical protein HC944_02920 [Nanoarchaeota archaeon]|nr:hypothetical protein [Nanoarchaeota archaeon]
MAGAKGLIIASDSVTRDEWKLFIEAQGASERFPGIQGVGLSGIIYGKDNLAIHLEQIRSKGFSEYNVWPEGDRNEYHPVVYLEPFNDRNQRAFGYDMFSEPIRREAMESARSSGLPILSGKITLVQETDDDIQSGFLIYFPLYDSKKPLQTTEDRINAFQGFVYAPFRMNDFMTDILSETTQDITFKIYDGDINSQNILYDYAKANEIDRSINDSFTKTITLTVDQRLWTIEFSAFNSLHENNKFYTIPLILVVGFSLSFTLFLYFVLITKYSYSRNNQSKKKK